MIGRALLLTGALATGKTTTAKEVIAIASDVGLNAAAIDLDWLGWITPISTGVDDLIARNLASVAGNYSAAGIDHLVLARAIISAKALEAVADALTGWELSVVRLIASRLTREQRIRARDTGGELNEHLAGLDETIQRDIEATPGASTVTNDQREVSEVARDVMRAAGWMAGDS